MSAMLRKIGDFLIHVPGMQLYGHYYFVAAVILVLTAIVSLIALGVS
jgi:hypothetical protein